MVEELLAQVVEEVSILTAKKFAREKPRQITRPSWVNGSDAEAPTRARNPFANAIDRMFGLMSSAQAG